MVVIALGFDRELLWNNDACKVVLAVFRRHISREMLTRYIQVNINLLNRLYVFSDDLTQNATHSCVAGTCIICDDDRRRTEVLITLSPADLTVAIVIRSAISYPDLYG